MPGLWACSISSMTSGVAPRADNESRTETKREGLVLLDFCAEPLSEVERETLALEPEEEVLRE